MTEDEYVAYCQQYYALPAASCDSTSRDRDRDRDRDMGATSTAHSDDVTVPSASPSSSSSSSSGGERGGAEGTGAGAAAAAVWEEFVDDETGATYYFNEASGESSWGAPPAAPASTSTS